MSKKISQMDIIPEVLDADYIEIVDASEVVLADQNKRVLMSALKTFFASSSSTDDVNDDSVITSGTATDALNLLDNCPYVGLFLLEPNPCTSTTAGNGPVPSGICKTPDSL